MTKRKHPETQEEEEIPVTIVHDEDIRDLDARDLFKEAVMEQDPSVQTQLLEKAIDRAEENDKEFLLLCLNKLYEVTESDQILTRALTLAQEVLDSKNVELYTIAFETLIFKVKEIL